MGTPTTAYKLQALTDVGQRRANNEDVAAAETLADGATLLAVADGVGGANAGEVASSMAIETLLGRVKSGGAAPPELLRGAFELANTNVHEAAAANKERSGMGTTLVAALIMSDKVWIASVGDSRAYLIESGKARQVTRDHTLAAEREKAGLLTDEERATGAGRNVITRSIGNEAAVDVDVFEPFELRRGSSLLLCSDGLHDVVGDDKIAGAFEAGDVAKELIRLANAAGGPDNIAVALLIS